MIELYLKTNEVKKFNFISEIDTDAVDLFNIRIIDYTDSILSEVSEKFGIDISIFKQKEDIEISSHYLKSNDQLSFNFSIPKYNSETLFKEEEIFIIIKNELVFYFLSSNIDNDFLKLTKTRYDFTSIHFSSHLEHFVFQIGIISDYYADLTEIISRRIKRFYENILNSKDYNEKDLDLIMILNFNNLLIKESISNFQRILHLLIQNKFELKTITTKINLELDDIAVISDHIQFNFERLDDLEDNINSKIDLEQNKIFRTLTIITVCISLPALIAGIYGMNFKNMPELEWEYGYPAAIGLMIISFVIALIYFKKKKWIK
ncbi:CorA family divalent cation transporter [Flavobacterium frigoris]|uniref:Magnesium transporter n=1 Tax=Flavobacterium frigoris TaxID=229204 RepID=A0A1H9QQI2_FLAFI|nr:CorA family divalent cation transporter [Flavobacterium frigoris]SER62712.1 magnesium transporter [Flavobacterium frigoris]